MQYLSEQMEKAEKSFIKRHRQELLIAVGGTVILWSFIQMIGTTLLSYSYGYSYAETIFLLGMFMFGGFFNVAKGMKEMVLNTRKRHDSVFDRNRVDERTLAKSGS
jgi:hypothetical protein